MSFDDWKDRLEALREEHADTVQTAQTIISTVTAAMSVYGGAASVMSFLVGSFHGGGEDTLTAQLNRIEAGVETIQKRLGELFREVNLLERIATDDEIERELQHHVISEAKDAHTATRDYLYNMENPDPQVVQDARGTFNRRFADLRKVLHDFDGDAYFKRIYFEELTFSAPPFTGRFIPEVEDHRVWDYQLALPAFLYGLAVLAIMYAVRKSTQTWDSAATDDDVKLLARSLLSREARIARGIMEIPRPSLRYIAYRIRRPVPHPPPHAVLVEPVPDPLRGRGGDWPDAPARPGGGPWFYRTILAPALDHPPVSPSTSLLGEWRAGAGAEGIPRPYGAVEPVSAVTRLETFPLFPVPEAPRCRECHGASDDTDAFWDTGLWSDYYGKAVAVLGRFHLRHRMRTYRLKMDLYRDLGLHGVLKAAMRLHGLVGKTAPERELGHYLVGWSVREVAGWCRLPDGPFSLRQLGVRLDAASATSLRRILEA